jgi:thiamine-phosphate pyrophosphorylase
MMSAQNVLAERFRLYLITDGKACSPEELACKVEKAIRGGVTAIQIREKHFSFSLVVRTIELLADACRPRGVLLLLNATLWSEKLPLDLIDGLHIQLSTWQEGGGKSDLLEWVKADSRKILVYSAHSKEEVVRLYEEGIPAFTISPLYPTPSKEGILEPLGPAYVNVTRRACPHAVLIGLGGISLENAHDVILNGADGVAVMRAIMDAKDPEAIAYSLRTIVDAAARMRAAGVPKVQ